MLLSLTLSLILVLVGILVFFRREIFMLRKHGFASCFAKAFFDMAARGGSMLKLSVGPFRAVVITKPEHMRVVLNSPHTLDKSQMNSFFRVDRGLFAAPAHIWKVERKVLGPSFGLAMLPRFVNIFNEKMSLFVQLAAEHEGKERNFQTDIGRYFMDITFATAFGIEFDLQRTAEGEKFVHLLDEYVYLITKRVFKPWLHLEFIYRMTKDFKRECEILKFAYEITDRAYHVKREEYGLSAKEEEPTIFAFRLLKHIEQIDSVDIAYIRDHALTIFLAGSDTSMTTVGNTMLMLAIHQDIQERVYEELMETIGPISDEPISQEKAAKLTYLEMVCKETMRLFPVAGAVGRKATERIVLDEYNTIELNSQIVLMFYTLQRNPEIWGSNATSFDPERFRPEAVSQRHPYAYLPFSSGPRMCMGVRYAWLSMKIMLGLVLRKYRLRTTLTMEDVCIDYDSPLIMKIKQGCQISMEER